MCANQTLLRHHDPDEIRIAIECVTHRGVNEVFLGRMEEAALRRILVQQRFTRLYDRKINGLCAQCDVAVFHLNHGVC